MLENIIEKLIMAYPDLYGVLINRGQVDFEFFKLSIYNPMETLISRKKNAVEKYGAKNIENLSEQEVLNHQNYYKMMVEEVNHLQIVLETLPFLFQGIDEMQLEIRQLKKEKELAKKEIETLDLVCVTYENTLSTYNQIIIKKLLNGDSSGIS